MLDRKEWLHKTCSKSGLLSIYRFWDALGSDLPAEAQQEALGVVSFKGCKLGVDQALVADPQPYAEQLIQGVIGVILNLDVE